MEKITKKVLSVGLAMVMMGGVFLSNAKKVDPPVRVRLVDPPVRS